jgi:hypothetical protein
LNQSLQHVQEFISKHSFSVKHIFKLAITEFQYVFCIESFLFPALCLKFIWFIKFKDLVSSLNVSCVMRVCVCKNKYAEKKVFAEMEFHCLCLTYAELPSE